MRVRFGLLVAAPLILISGQALAAFVSAVVLKPASEPPGVLQTVAARNAVVETLQAAVRQAPTDARLHFALASAYDDWHRSRAAAPEYQAALHLDPTYPRVHLRLGEDYGNLGRLALAEQQLRLAVGSDPASASAHDRLADVLTRERHDPAAIAEYQKAARLDPASLTADRALLAVESRDGRFQEAIQAGLRVLQTDPNETETLDGLASCCIAEKLWVRAGAYSQRALQIQSSDPQAHTNLGIVYLNQGHEAAALAQWRQVVSSYHCEAGQGARNQLAKYHS